MVFTILDEVQKAACRNEILSIMEQNDSAFVPPLSARASTLQSELSSGAPVENGILSYYQEMNTQHILGAFAGGKLMGFVSYRENLQNETLTRLPNIYLSTLMLLPEARGQRLTYRIYDHLFNRLYPDRTVYTRTWSTNTAHTKILLGFGFSELRRLQNHRGPGIDTVYYQKLPAKECAL